MAILPSAFLLLLARALGPINVVHLFGFGFVSFDVFALLIARIVVVFPRLLFARLLLVRILIAGHVALPDSMQ
jgi:hypothetical protein